MRKPMRLPHYLEIENVVNYEGTPNYIISRAGSIYRALNTENGTIYENTDYATVAQACIDALPVSASGETDASNGAWIHNKFGWASVSKKITLNKTCRFTGNNRGYGTTLFLAAGVNDTLLTVFAAGTGHANLEYLTFEGNKANNNMGTNPLVKLAGYSIMRDCYLMRAEDIGLSCVAGDQHLYNVYVEYCGADAFSISAVNNVTMTNCTAYGNTGEGIFATHLTGTIMGCRIMLNSGSGAELYHTTYLTVIGNWFAQNNLHGLKLNGSHYNVVQGNVFRDNSQGTDNAYDAINLTSSTYNVISGNVILGTGALADHKYGIDETGGSCAYNSICCNNNTGAQTADYLLEAEHGSTINGTAAETANAETPALLFPIGTIVNFTDSGDASGNGYYIKNSAGSWVKLA